MRMAEEATFLAFAALEVLSSVVSSSLATLTADVSFLVGEVNFDTFVRRRPPRRGSKA